MTEPVVTNHSTPDPLNPPMVEVLIDDTWWPGFVRAQEQRDGAWVITVQYSRDGANYLDGFTTDQVRKDRTDHSRGRAGAV